MVPEPEKQSKTIELLSVPISRTLLIKFTGFGKSKIFSLNNSSISLDPLFEIKSLLCHNVFAV